MAAENSERESLLAHEKSKERVGQRIGKVIESLLNGGWTEFHLAELDRAVWSRVGDIAPGSVSRIMRDLRQKGRINYELVSRSKSLYRALPLTTTQENTK